MSDKIDAYGMIGDLGTAALISNKGSLDWLCWPDFDSEACFASLIGTKENGFWSLAPRTFRIAKQRYLPGTMVLETTYTKAFGGSVTVTDFMPVRDGHSAVVRIVRGVKGRMRMRTCLAPRFDYGSSRPWFVQQDEHCWSAVIGPHRVSVHSDLPLELASGDLSAEWIIKEGETYSFALQYSTSFQEAVPAPIKPEAAQQQTASYWQKWSAKNAYTGQYREAVNRSLLTLKALTFAASGGFVAAPTTSLPEKVGGIRNWDYRFCWLRDTTFSLLGMLQCGYSEDAKAWLGWLSRAIQGNPDAMQILYGVSGKREHSEWTAGWLNGYKGSKPVHIGNKASGQLQLGVFGEVLDALYRARQHGLYPHEDQSGAALEIPILNHLEKVWSKPDKGIWEFRSDARQFTQSMVMAWVAFDRGVRMIEQCGMEGPVERWRKIRDTIHAQVCSKGFHRGSNAFTLAYGSKFMDASLLMMPLVGFLPPDDPRVIGTVAAIEKKLMRKGLIHRYDTRRVDDGLPAGEGAFLACNFWLVENYVLQQRHDEARALFERLLALRSDVGLLSEEYDPKIGMVGNYPQALSHIAMIHAALALELKTSPRLRHLS